MEVIKSEKWTTKKREVQILLLRKNGIRQIDQINMIIIEESDYNRNIEEKTFILIEVSFSVFINNYSNSVKRYFSKLKQWKEFNIYLLFEYFYNKILVWIFQLRHDVVYFWAGVRFLQKNATVFKWLLGIVVVENI